MQLGYGLQQEQSQKLLMTTQMKQAIELLQCSREELLERLQEWTAENPLVEIEWPTYAREYLAHKDERRDSSAPSQRPAVSAFDYGLSAQSSMYDELSSQLRCMNPSPGVLRVALHLAGCLDESGYLMEPLEDISARLTVSDDGVVQALKYVQSCEPKGIGARSLEECLVLQLDAIPESDRALTKTVIQRHLTDAAANKFSYIAKACKQDVRRIQQVVDGLKRLNPKPGLTYAQTHTHYVVPDVVVRDMDGEYLVMTNESAEPKLHIPPKYFEWMGEDMDAETRQYVARKLQSAEWLVRSLEQRRQTLYKVSKAIVDMQKAFFIRGMSAMQPLTLRQIADLVGVHESTVSRATRGKYMLTPRGLYELKFFFTAELQRTGGCTSAQAAKYEIQKLIEGENRLHPLSDEEIAKSLQHSGTRISRRTVAKYREEMNISPSWRRKRYAN